jgi:hypothetical protein
LLFGAVENAALYLGMREKPCRNSTEGVAKEEIISKTFFSYSSVQKRRAHESALYVARFDLPRKDGLVPVLPQRVIF